MPLWPYSIAENTSIEDRGIASQKLSSPSLGSLAIRSILGSARGRSSKNQLCGLSNAQQNEPRIKLSRSVLHLVSHYVYIPTRKERTFGVELRSDAANGPNVDGRGVVGRSQEDLGGAVPADRFPNFISREHQLTDQAYRLNSCIACHFLLSFAAALADCYWTTEPKVEVPLTQWKYDWPASSFRILKEAA